MKRQNYVVVHCFDFQIEWQFSREEPTIGLVSWIEESDGAGMVVGRRGGSANIPCRRSAIAFGCRNKDFCLFLGKTLRSRRETLFAIMSYPLWHKMPRANCQTSDLTNVPGKAWQKWTITGDSWSSAAFQGQCCFVPPGRVLRSPCGCGRLLIFATLARIHVFRCFLLCLRNAVTNSSCAFWRTCSFGEAYLKSPNHMTHPVISPYLVV